METSGDCHNENAQRTPILHIRSSPDSLGQPLLREGKPEIAKTMRSIVIESFFIHIPHLSEGIRAC